MLTDNEKYSLTFRTGIVAGVFSFVVGMLLLVDYGGRVSEDPLNSPKFQTVKKQLSENPADDAIKQEIRTLDLQLRQAYFQHRWLTQWGAWLLLGGIATTLICAKFAGTIRRRLPQPHPGTGPEDVDEHINGISRWSIAALALTTALCTLGMYVGLRSVLPSDERQLAAMLDDSSERDTLDSIRTPAPDSPTIKPESEQPVDPATSPPTAERPENTWPRFRGPGGLGISAYTNLPTTWNGETGEGIRWKTAVPLPGNSSPVVWGSRVFLTGASEEERVVTCFDADSGQILWQTVAPSELDPAAEPPEVGETTGFAACTPATDGRRVYAMFANGDLVGIDYEGNVVWSRSLGVPDNVYGHAASLTTYEDLLIVPFDQGSKKDGKSRLLGIDCASGETVWETVREVPNAWTTPIVIQHEGQPQIITAADPWLIAYSTEDGKELWRVECLQADVGPSPTFADGVVYSANEFPGAAAVRVPAAGTAEAEIIWEADIGAPDCASPLVTDQFVLLLASYGTLTCYDAKEGVDPLWEEDFDDSSFTSSPTLVGSLVYLFGEEGRGYVVEPTTDACKRVAESHLGEGCVTSPAFQDGRIYLRGAEHLFCVESEPTDTPDAPMPADSATDPPAAEQPENTWPRFRGPGGLGVSAYTNLPTTWNGETGEGIRWKTAVPLPGNSSPVVWGSRVFLTGASEEERVVTCFDADSGQILWQTTAPSELDPAAEPPEVGETTGFAACTPATDGRRVYAMFANGDLVGIDYEGNVVWSRSLGVPDNVYGHAASLTTYEDLLIVPFDQGSKKDGKSRLLGIDSASGETVWETVREVPNAWTTPIVIQHEGQPQIITAADPWLIAYSTKDGKELWRVECLQADVGPSPTFADGVVYSANEFPGAAAIRVPAAGTTEAEILWEADIGAPDCASPLVTDQFVLLLASYGTLTCYDAKEGVDPLWEEDFDDSMFTSSPTLAGSLVYLFGEEGRGYVVEPTVEACKRIAESHLGEGCVTSPAFQDGRIYIRGAEHLFCIGTKDP